MKKTIGLILSAAMLLSTVPQAFAAGETQASAYKDIYVSPNGNDSADGSTGSPFKTLERAQQEVRAVNSSMTGDIVVHIANGKYFLDKTMVFEVEDSGRNGHNVIWQGEDKENTVISGGKAVTGFKQSDKEGIWEADAPDFEYIYQLAVNGERRYVAKTANMIKGVKKPAELDTKEYYAAHPDDPGNEYKYTYSDPETPYKFDGIFISKRDLGIYENAEDMFVWQDKDWATAYMSVDDIIQNPYASDEVIVKLDNPFFSSHAYASFCPFNPPRPFYVLNAMELLDEPGEFYFNKKTKKLYYMPCEGEDMNTAEVIAPKIDGIMVIYGNDIDDRVTNITFNNLTFSDTAWEYNSADLNQAVSTRGLRVHDRGFRGVTASYVDNVNFTDNVFCNIAGTAIEYSNACKNSSASGNTIYDIGESGIIVGMKNQGDFCFAETDNPNPTGMSWPVPEEHKNDPVNLIVAEHTRVNASVYGGENGTVENLMTYGTTTPDDVYSRNYVTMNKTWFDEASLTGPYENQAPYGKTTTWKDSKSYKDGEKPWVKYEFMKPYNLDEIILAFSPDLVSDAEKSDFEILGSNDINFKEYDVLATQNGAVSGEYGRYKIETDKKYQYVMVRSLDAKAFAISGTWITTYDVKPFVKLQRCSGINIENNMLHRIGIDFPRSIGVIFTHVDNSKIMHNDLKDIGYTGISVGYRWDIVHTTCRNVEVGYNRIADNNQTMHDGGGIYTLGPQPNSVYHHNYINTTNQSNFALYFDNGSRYMTWRDNLVLGAMYIISIRMNGGQGMQDNDIYDNYGNHSYSVTGGAELNNYTPQILIPTGSVVDAKSYDTFYNSGVEKEYKSNLDLVPNLRDGLEFKYEVNYAADAFERETLVEPEKKAISEWLSYTLSNTDFGEGLGQMPKKYKYELKHMISYFEGSENTDMYMRRTRAHELERELSTAVKRYSLDETLALCEEKLAFVKENLVPSSGKLSCDKYPVADAQVFESELNAVKALITGSMSIEEEYKLVLRLEKAYNAIEAKRNVAEINYVYANELTDVDINYDTREVTLYVPKSAGNTLTGFEMDISPNASLARILGSEVNLSDPITVPLRVNGNGRYKLWKISLVHEGTDGNPNLGEANWVTTTDEAELMNKTYADGSKCLAAGEYIYMADACSDKENYVSFNPMTKNKNNEFSVILGAEKLAGQEKSTTINNRCEVVFTNNKADFYKVVNGSKTLITTAANVPIKYNEKNTLKYSIEEIDNNLYFKVYLNDKQILSPVVEKYPYGNFMGLTSKYMNIKIYK